MTQNIPHIMAEHGIIPAEAVDPIATTRATAGQFGHPADGGLIEREGWYRKKPVAIEARQFWTNNEAFGAPHMDDLVAWCGDCARHDGTSIYIDTLEGTHRADVGDWIIKGIKGEFYPCKSDIFEATYEAIRALPAAQPAPDHRSFPEASDGRPMPPMGDDLMTAGLNGDDARFVAIQLAQNGLMLVPAAQPAQEPWGWWVRDLTLPPEKGGFLITKRDRLDAIATPPEEWEVTPLFTAPAAQDGAEVEMADARAAVNRLGRAMGTVPGISQCFGDVIDEAIKRCAERDALQAENDRLRPAVEWYGEQARLCRLIHGEGDAGRQALDADGGKRARAALRAEQGETR